MSFEQIAWNKVQRVMSNEQCFRASSPTPSPAGEGALVLNDGNL